MSDITAGILGAMGCAAAYAHKIRTGEGQRVDTSLFEAGITHTYWQSAICFATGVSPGPMGSAHPLNAPYEAFETSDGWLNLGAANQANWERLVNVIGAEQLKLDPRFVSNRARMENREALASALSSRFRSRGTEEWLKLLDDAGVPAGPVLSIAEMHEHPQTVAREMVIEVEHPIAGTIKTLGTPVKFHGTPGGVRAPAPIFGQHTRAVLAEAGYADHEIEAVIDAGAAVAAPESSNRSRSPLL